MEGIQSTSIALMGNEFYLHTNDQRITCNLYLPMFPPFSLAGYERWCVVRPLQTTSE